MKHVIIFLSLLCVLFSPNEAQAQYPEKTIETTFNYSPSSWGGDGCNLKIQFRLKVHNFMGEPTRQVVAKATKVGNEIYYKGKTYSRQEVGDEVWDAITIGNMDFVVDVHLASNNRKLTMMTLKNVSDFDATGSPDWDELFDTYNEEEAKELYKLGFTFRNVRIFNSDF